MSSKSPDFHQDFLEAWQRWLQSKVPPDLPQQEPCSFVIFLDNQSMMEVPWFYNIGDRDLLAYLQGLHGLARAEKQVLFKFSLQVLGRIDVAEVTGNMAVGERIRTLNLGRTTSNRQTYLLSHHEHLEGNNIVTALLDDGVIRVKDSAKTHCLNFTSTWSTEAIGSIVGTPLLLSILSCMVWPIVAVLKYGADVQTSVQTGVTIGGFIVTASALLIALVAFLDTMGSRETDNSSRKRVSRGRPSRGKPGNLRALRSGKDGFRVVRRNRI